MVQVMNSLLPNSGLEMEIVGKTTRPFRYDVNQTTYGYTVEVTNRFKTSDLVERAPEELRKEVCNII